MTTHGKRHAKQDIMDAAWKLFTEQGYDETTIAQIIELSGNSRSTFYHHFRGKDELLFSLAYSYDSDYDSWLQTCDRTLPAADLLLAFNHFVLNNLEHSPYMDLFAPLYGLQVATTGTRHILNPDRNPFRWDQMWRTKVRLLLRRALPDDHLCPDRSHLLLVSHPEKLLPASIRRIPPDTIY